MGRRAAREELQAGSDSQFDGSVVRAFLTALDRVEAHPALEPDEDSVPETAL